MSLNDMKLAGRRVCILGPRDASLDGRLQKEVRALKKAGATIKVIYRDRTHFPELLEDDVEWIALSGNPEFELPRLGNEDVWWPLRVLVNLTITKIKLKKYHARQETKDLTFFDEQAAQEAVKFNPDFIQANDIYTLRTGHLASLKSGSKLVYNPYELFDSYFSCEEMQAKANKAEGDCIPQCDLIIAAWPGIRESLQARFPNKKMVAVLNSLPDALVQTDATHNPVRLVSQGGIRRLTHDVNLVKAMVYLKGRAHLTLQGKSVDAEHENEITDVIKSNNLEGSVTLSGPFENSESISILEGFDVGLCVFKPDTPSKNKTLANRLFAYMNAGLAVVLGSTQAHREFPSVEKFALIIDPETPESIAKGIELLLEQPDEIIKLGKSAKEMYAQYSWEVQESNLIEAYNNLWAEE